MSSREKKLNYPQPEPLTGNKFLFNPSFFILSFTLLAQLWRINDAIGAIMKGFIPHYF
jgi:hypothetical protein